MPVVQARASSSKEPEAVLLLIILIVGRNGPKGPGHLFCVVKRARRYSLGPCCFFFPVQQIPISLQHTGSLTLLKTVRRTSTDQTCPKCPSDLLS